MYKRKRNEIKILFTCFLLIFLPGLRPVKGQQPAIDSLRKVTEQLKEDSSKVLSLLDMSRELMQSSLDSSFIYAARATALAGMIGFKSGQAQAVKTMGIIRYTQANYVEAIDYWEKSLSLFNDLGDQTGVSNILSNIGVIYYNQGEKAKALDYYFRSLKVAEDNKIKIREAIALNNIGTVYFENSETQEKAVEYFLKALPIMEELGDMDSYGTTSTNLGEIYASKKDEKTALLYFNKALNAFTDSISLSYTLNKMGNLYSQKKDLSTAIQYHLQAYNITRKLDAKLEMAESLLGLANTYREQGHFKTAISTYLQAEAYGRETGAFSLLEKIYNGLAISYESGKDYSNALKYQGLYASVKDTLYDSDADKKLSRLIFNFEIEKKESQIDLLTKDKALKDLELSRQKYAKNALLAGLALIISIAVMLYRNYRMKAKTNEILDRKNAEIERLLLNILPAEIANELKAEGVSTPRYFDQASVLFTDFKSFTKMADVLSPQELVAELNECFMAFDDIIEKHKLEKIKTIGDSYMCAGGIPTPDNNHVHNVLKAAFDIMKYLDVWNEKRIKSGQSPWELRIGIHVGPVVAGVVGKKKYAYDIWGSTVNIASRMESAGEPGKVNVSEKVYEIIKDKYHCHYRGKISAKNIGDVDMYFVDSPDIIIPKQNVAKAAVS